MKKRILLIMGGVLFVVGNVTLAELVNGIDIEFVSIGNAGNAPHATGYGSVDYEYRIGKYEITNSQWNAFTSAAGAPTGNPSNAYLDGAFFTGDDQPTTGVGWYEAAQFCNYLTSGDKSKGVYQFSGDNTNPADYLGINRSAALSDYGIIYCLPTVDEWYKAAYYRPDGSGYSLYANGTNIAPTAGVQSNYDQGFSGIPWNIGTGIEEQNGTFDMMGNVWEWNETESFIALAHMGIGGSFIEGSDKIVATQPPVDLHPYEQLDHLGFRVLSIPEPFSITLLLFGSLATFCRRGRK